MNGAVAVMFVIAAAPVRAQHSESPRAAVMVFQSVEPGVGTQFADQLPS